MISMENDDLETNILKPCFPSASNVQIIKKSIGGINQHFTSDILCLTVEFVQDGKQQMKQLVMKVPKRDQTSACYKKLDFYNRETVMYRVMIPHINNYLDSPIIPIGYYVTDSDVLILENVTAQGYVARDKKKLFTLKECYPVLESLAEFHAASCTAYQQHPHILNHLPFQKITILYSKQNIIESWEPVFCKLLERNKAVSMIPKFSEAMNYLLQEDGEIRSKMHQSNFKFIVLNHGDFRINNLLLKYNMNDQDVLEDVKIIDFQTCVWSSPVIDIIYFFTTSVPIDIVDAHFETLVIWYLEHLNDRLQKLNCPKTYILHEFMTDLRKSSALFILYILTSSFILCPLDQSQIEDSFFDTKEENTHGFDVCLDDEVFVHSSYGWLKFFEKIGGFDAIQNRSSKNVPVLEHSIVKENPF